MLFFSQVYKCVICVCFFFSREYVPVDSPKSCEGWDGASPVHGEEEESGCRLTDVVYIQILRHGAGHCQLKRRSKQNAFSK